MDGYRTIEFITIGFIYLPLLSNCFIICYVCPSALLVGGDGIGREEGGTGRMSGFGSCFYVGVYVCGCLVCTLTVIINKPSRYYVLGIDLLKYSLLSVGCEGRS